MTCKPPAFLADVDSGMSVPRPAILVAIVTTPCPPAWETISASFPFCLALDRVRNVGFPKECRQAFRCEHRNCSNEYGAALIDQFNNLSPDILPFLVSARPNGCLVRVANVWAVCRNQAYFHSIELFKLVFRSFCRPGHSNQMLVATKQLLYRDSGSISIFS